MDTEELLNQYLNDVASTLNSGEEVFTSGRQLLDRFGFKRRSSRQLYIVGLYLVKHGLKLDPGINEVWIDGPIQFRLIDSVEKDHTPEVPEVLEERVSEAIFKDATYRVNRLEASNRGVKSVHSNDSVAKAVTIMMQHDYSQLPVMESDRKVVGIISWKSLGLRLMMTQTCERVGDAMDSAIIVGDTESIFSVIPQIVASGYVLVRRKDNTISGIVTTSDLSAQFRELSEPFLLLGEIESHLRGMIDQKFSAEDLAKALDPNDQKTVTSAADLSIGEYLWLLQNPENWEKLKLTLDRIEVTKQLDEVRIIRNDVMHFDPEGIEESELETLRAFVCFLRELKRLGVI